MGHKLPIATFLVLSVKCWNYEFWVGGGTEGVHLSQAKG